MSEQPPRRTLNLGRYSIRPPDRSVDFRNGALWRQQHGLSSTDSDQEFTAGEEGSGTKRLAISNNDKPTYNRRDSLASASIDSATSQPTQEDTPATDYEQSGIRTNKLQALEERFNGRLCQQSTSGHEEESQQSSILTSKAASFTLYIDTQASSAKNIYDDDTHESIVVNVNPAAYNSSIISDTQDQDSRTDPVGPQDYVPYTPNQAPKGTRKKVYPKQLPYTKIMSGVIFVMSGYENPRRSKLRDMAIQMGAKYETKWNRFCTHLICAFKNTPKYKEVMAENGRIVREHWIQECSRQKQLIDWRTYKLGNYPYPDSEEEVDVDDLDYALRRSKYGADTHASKD